MRTLIAPQVHLWSREEYYKMAAAGLFAGKTVELIEGQIVEMSPMGSLHATAVTLIARVLERAFGDGYFVRWQMPLEASKLSEPEPDVAVIAGDVRDYKDAHPTTAVLVVEVADSSLEYDRGTKSRVYAKAGIADYWVVNLIDSQVELYRRPVVGATDPDATGYADVTRLKRTDVVKPLALPALQIAVADLLP